MREFRAHHSQLVAEGITVAGVTRDSLASNLRWSARLRLPYPLLSDPEGQAGRAFGIVRRIGIGSWSLELFRRSSILIDARGVVATVWENVKTRGHASQVIEAARTLPRPGAGGPPSPAAP